MSVSKLDELACSTCQRMFDPRLLCRWDRADRGRRYPQVGYLCADCCPYCSDERHSIAPDRCKQVWGDPPVPEAQP